MCFSVQVQRDLEKLAMRFGAGVSKPAFQEFTRLQEKAEQTPPETLKEWMGLKRKPSSPLFKKPAKDDRIYPGYFAPVIVLENGKRVIKPMRYRVRPAHSTEEIPSQYNVFNARLDSLENRRTWKSIFLKNHGLFPFLRFFEWVEKDGQKKLIHFYPKDREIIWAPMIYDQWSSPGGELQFSSFALITTDPPKEVDDQGHDRCPVFIKESDIDTWLKVQELSRDKAFDILNHKENVTYLHGF